MIRATIARLLILLFGVLFPAYSSFKTIKERDLNSYVKWMMYWIVFALFTCIETFTDVFLSWFPIYYELKIAIIMWLASPATRGSTYLYKKFVHPTFCRKQDVIDDYILKVREETYKQVADIGYMSCAYIVETAIRSGGGIVNHIRKSYSLSDLSDRQNRHEDDAGSDEVDDLPSLRRKRQSPSKRTTSGQMAPLYFSEFDVRTEGITSSLHSETMSSGYSSNETLMEAQAQSRDPLARAGSLKARPTRITRAGAVSVPKKAATTDEGLERMRQDSSSSEDNEFLDTIDHEEEEPEGSKVQGNTPYDAVHPVDEQRVDPETNLPNNPQAVAHFGSPSEEGDSKDKRAGKYHKKHAPTPPGSSQTGAITATLVLQPGVIKPIGNDEVFCHSPKMRRRLRSKSKSRSPSPSRSPTLYRKLFNKSPTPSKKDPSTMASKLMGLFKHDEKRSSWHGSSDPGTE